MKHERVLTNLLIALMILTSISLHPEVVDVHAVGPTKTQLENAINLGIAWMNRHYLPIGTTGYSAVRDHSAVPIYIQDVSTGEVRMAGDQSGQNDYSVIPTFSTNGQQYEIDFETGTDWNHDDIKLNVTYTAVSDTQVQASVKMLAYAPDNGHAWAVYLAGTLLASGNWVGQTMTLTSPVGAYGWNSFRYAHRHTQRLAQSVYTAISDPTRALQLEQLMVDKGFSTDLYDPMFFRGGSSITNSLPDTFGTWDRNWWDEYVYFNNTWSTWWPKGLGGINAGYAYKSRILGAPTQTDWQSPPLQVLINTPLYSLSRAMQLMNQNPSGFDRPTVTGLIDGVRWDGSGVEGPCGSPNDTCITVLSLPYHVTGYQIYNTAYYLAAATMYDRYTGLGTYATQIDQAANQLVAAQATSRLINTVDYGTLDRPDAYGGFYTGYRNGSLLWKETGGHGALENLWLVEQQLGWFTRMGPESALPVLVSGESTTLGLWALKVYEAYGTLNLGWNWNSQVKFTASAVDCSHGGTSFTCRSIALYELADIRLYVTGGLNRYATAGLYSYITQAVTVNQITLRHFLSGQLVGDSAGAQISVTIQVFNSVGVSQYSNTRLLYQANAFQTVNVEAARSDVWSGLSLSAQPNWFIVFTYNVTTPGTQGDAAYADFGSTDTPNFSPPVQYFIRVAYLKVNSLNPFPITTVSGQIDTSAGGNQLIDPRFGRQKAFIDKFGNMLALYTVAAGVTFDDRLAWSRDGVTWSHVTVTSGAPLDSSGAEYDSTQDVLMYGLSCDLFHGSFTGTCFTAITFTRNSSNFITSITQSPSLEVKNAASTGPVLWLLHNGEWGTLINEVSGTQTSRVMFTRIHYNGPTTAPSYFNGAGSANKVDTVQSFGDGQALRMSLTQRGASHDLVAVYSHGNSLNGLYDVYLNVATWNSATSKWTWGTAVQKFSQVYGDHMHSVNDPSTSTVYWFSMAGTVYSIDGTTGAFTALTSITDDWSGPPFFGNLAVSLSFTTLTHTFHIIYTANVGGAAISVRDKYSSDYGATWLTATLYQVSSTYGLQGAYASTHESSALSNQIFLYTAYIDSSNTWHFIGIIDPINKA